MHKIGGCGGLGYGGGRLKMYMLLQMIAMSRRVVRLMLLYRRGVKVVCVVVVTSVRHE